MTKRVRIENADNSSFKVLVETWEKHYDGDVLVNRQHLDNPTNMAEAFIHSGRYLLIKEA